MLQNPRVSSWYLPLWVYFWGFCHYLWASGTMTFLVMSFFLGSWYGMVTLGSTIWFFLFFSWVLVYFGVFVILLCKKEDKSFEHKAFLYIFPPALYTKYNHLLWYLQWVFQATVLVMSFFLLLLGLGVIAFMCRLFILFLVFVFIIIFFNSFLSLSFFNNSFKYLSSWHPSFRYLS